MKIEQCPLFSFCNCKTAMCRVVLPDESCYWYKYFDKLIKQHQSQEETEAMKDYFNNLKKEKR